MSHVEQTKAKVVEYQVRKEEAIEMMGGRPVTKPQTQLNPLMMPMDRVNYKGSPRVSLLQILTVSRAKSVCLRSARRRNCEQLLNINFE